MDACKEVRLVAYQGEGVVGDQVCADLVKQHAGEFPPDVFERRDAGGVRTGQAVGP
ncbi:hypothetical protein [Streptomyces filamentosus]|uniref:hypothetical protein n=1 Tax=Streptomyces filamentosus TaxID=67294 RepID=UPI0033FD99B8